MGFKIQGIKTTTRLRALPYMDITSEKLKKRYESLSTDELLQIKAGSRYLTQEADKLLKAELSKRDVTLKDYESANQFQKIEEADNDKIKSNFKIKFRRILGGVLSIAIAAIYFQYIAPMFE